MYITNHVALLYMGGSWYYSLVPCKNKISEQLQKKGKERNIIETKGQAKGRGQDRKRDKGTRGSLQVRNM